MVYATRSRAITRKRSTSPSARAMGSPKPAPKRKRPSSSSSNPLTRRRHSITKDATTRTKDATTRTKKIVTKKAGEEEEEKGVKVAVDGGVLMSIDTQDEHGGHVRDGKEHHLLEQDGRNRHHIFFENFEKMERTGGPGEAMDVDVDVNSDIYTLRDGHQVHHGVPDDTASGHDDAAPAAPTAQPREHRQRRASTTKSSSSPPSSAQTKLNTGPAPLVIHVEHTRRKHSLDGLDHHLIEADGRDHHHIRYGDYESTSNQHGSGSGTRHETSSHKVAKKSVHGTAHHATGGEAPLHKETKHSHTPMHQIGSVVVTDDGLGHQATTRHFEGSDTTTITTTTTTASSSHEQNQDEEQHNRLRTRDAAAVRLVTQKTQLDRSKARDAILSLDSDVVQLQKLLQENEDALRAAENQTLTVRESTTVRTETLTREVHDLQTTIRELRTHLAAKEMELKTVKKSDQKEIRDKEKQSAKVAKDLAAATHQRDLLAAQVRTMSDSIKTREAELKTVQSSLKGLEKSNTAQSKQSKKLSHQLEVLREGMQKKETELRECRTQIQQLEGEHAKVLALSAHLKALRTKLSDREGALKGLEKENKSLAKDHEKALSLTEEVTSLTQEIHESEDMLRRAQLAVDDLVGFRDRAATLEVEVHDLRDQVNIHEKHETDLEDALMRHENCAMESQQLQGAVNELQARLNSKQSEIRALQGENSTMHTRDEAKIEQLQGEVSALQAEMSAHDAAAEKLKEKSEKDLAKINSSAGTLRMEVHALRQQLKDKTKELKQHDKSHARDQAQNSALTSEIHKLELLIETKDHHMQELDKVIATMSKQAEVVDRLEGEVLTLQRDSQEAADKSAKSLSAMASAASKASQQIDDLKAQLAIKETELKAADEVAQTLESKFQEIKSLLAKMTALETSSSSHLTRAQKAEESGKSLKSEIKALEARLLGLQNDLSTKENALKDAVSRAEKDHEEGVHRIEDLRGVVEVLRNQFEDAEKKAKAQIRAKEGDIAALKKQLSSLEKHELAKVDELQREIEKETALLHQKESQVHALLKTSTEQTHEIGRLNTLVSETRSELLTDRQRRASEIEESDIAKVVLESQISDMKEVNTLLEEKVFVEHQHEVELEGKVKELLAWKQIATAQLKDREATMAKLRGEKDHLTEQVSGFERQVLDLQLQLQQVTTAHTTATQQCDKLTHTISKLEREVNLMKGVVVQHDKDEANAQAHLVNLQGHAQSLENAKIMMERDLERKDGVIEELEEMVKSKAEGAKMIAAGAKKDMAEEEKVIQGLHARIMDLDRTTTTLQSTLEKSEAAHAKTQHALETSQANLAACTSQISTLTTQAHESSQLITTLRRQTLSLQQEISTIETKIQSEMTTTKELTEMLAQLRKSMTSDSEMELKKLDQLETELKNRAGSVEDTVTTIRSRMDSGAFLEHAESTTTATAANASSSADAITGTSATTTAH
ncbi:hypothetical protein KI688_007673 [Linnemannia hyalina]|uniref:Uncharacterized protein n=1 Tax=Linnemannia hyalina TaxID=64524 RepID=A0A9P8BLY1_9FUNG|nr:hypothetical protein KI688_007673 [Linnemannia hyalina]